MDFFNILRNTSLFYGFIYQFFTPKTVATMNYGYAPIGMEARSHPTMADQPHQLELYWQAFSQLAHPLTADQTLCEISAGRGGGLEFISRYTDAPVMGLERSAAARRYAKNRFGLSVRHTQAPRLQLPDASVDVLLSIEALHQYATPEFMSEVSRCLKPGGHLLIADRNYGPQLRTYKKILANSDLSILGRRDITANVLDSLQQDNDRKLAGLARVPGPFRAEAKNFALTTDSERYQEIIAGNFYYQLAHIQKAPVNHNLSIYHQPEINN
jgi:SAM-dependent methyltransferase